MNEKRHILILISLNFVSKGTFSNTSALVKVMAWRQPGDKPLSEPTVGGIVRRKRSRDLRFGEFASESSALFGVKKLLKWFQDIWSNLDI